MLYNYVLGLPIFIRIVYLLILISMYSDFVNIGAIIGVLFSIGYPRAVFRKRTSKKEQSLRPAFISTVPRTQGEAWALLQALKHAESGSEYRSDCKPGVDAIAVLENTKQYVRAHVSGCLQLQLLDFICTNKFQFEF